MVSCPYSCDVQPYVFLDSCDQPSCLIFESVSFTLCVIDKRFFYYICKSNEPFPELRTCFQYRGWNGLVQYYVYILVLFLLFAIDTRRCTSLDYPIWCFGSGVLTSFSCWSESGSKVVCCSFLVDFLNTTCNDRVRFVIRRLQLQTSIHPVSCLFPSIYDRRKTAGQQGIKG